MSSHLIRGLFLMLFWLFMAGLVGAQQGLSTEQFATEVAERLRDKRPDVVDRPIHWLFCIDTSGSMNGKSDAVGKMLRAFLSSTVVEGDLVSRIRFDSTLKTKDEPTGLAVGSLAFSIDKIANGLDPRRASPDTDGETVAAQARNYCQSFVQDKDPGHIRVAVLLSDSGANDGKAQGTQGADARSEWSGSVLADRGKTVTLVALYWYGSPVKVGPLPITTVRKVAEKVETEVSPSRPKRDPDGAKRRTYETVPWVLGAISAIAVAFALLMPSSAKLRVTGKSAELKLPWYGAPEKATVNSGGPTFHLTRAAESKVVDGASVVSFAIEEPHRIWQAPIVKVEGLNDPVSDANFELEVNGSGYDYRGRLRPGKSRLSVRSGAGVVVREESIKLVDSGLRYLLLGIVALIGLWLAFFIFGPSYRESLKPHIPAEPAHKEWVARDLVVRSQP